MRRPGRWAPAVVLVLVAVALALEITRVVDRRGSPHASTASRDVARQFAVAITSFDHKRLDADVARVLALGTPGFEGEFRRAMGPDFAKRFTDNKTISVGHIVAGPRVQRTGNGRATFLVVVDQQITSEGAQNTAPKLDQIVLLVTVLDGGGRVANVEEVHRSS